MPIDLTGLDLEELTDVEVSLVSRRPERLAAATAVVTGEDIRCSGVTSLAEALLLWATSPRTGWRIPRAELQAFS